MFRYTLLVDAGVALVFHAGAISTAGITFRAHPAAMIHLFIGRPTDTVVVGINVVALGMWFAIRRAGMTMDVRSEAPRAAPPETSDTPG